MHIYTMAAGVTEGHSFVRVSTQFVRHVLELPNVLQSQSETISPVDTSSQ